MDLFQQEFERCALLSLEKREKLLGLAGDHFLELDLDAGAARFREGLSLEFQVLGTESENTLSWLWAWADEQTEMPDRLVRSARDLRQWFQDRGMQEIIRPSVDLDVADGNRIAMIGAEALGAGAYYRDRYEGGALFLLLFGGELHAQPDLDRGSLLRVFRDLTAQYPCDHRNVLASYARAKGLPAAGSDDMLNLQLAGGERILAEFSSGGSLLRINGEPFE